MPIQSTANFSSIAEKSKKFVFPMENDIRSKIPLWMKFYCYEYSNTAAGRSIAYSRSAGGANVLGLSNEKAQILVPAPVNFQSSTAHNYGNEKTSANFIFPNFYGDLLDKGFDKLPNDVKEILLGIKSTFTQVDQLINSMTGDVTGFNSQIAQDHSDTMYIGSGASRTFEVRLNLPCLTERDSKAAGSLIRAFEALSLPTGRSLFSLTTTKFFHPPLWVFGIGPADSLKFDPDWTGYPQISVLRTVAHKKTAFETNSLAAIGYNGLLKPVAYSLTLVFQELEPAFRITNPFGGTSTQITNRSGILFTTGTTVPARIIGQ